ncbi:hypothetical protein ACL9RI_23625 [Janthinobacterium sp. Mn2066]|uniref:hypothetical protein n=1 Tax=Janthinobacterium sp. Mn2066 TaxID=3395264 RepID=UPI003BD62790
MLPDLINVSVSFSGQITLHAAGDILPIILNGHDITARLWQLAGAFDGSKLSVKISSSSTIWGETEAVVLSVEHPYLKRPMIREILLIPQGGLLLSVMHNVEFYLKQPFRGQGIGAFSLATEAIAAWQLGFTKIMANAANHPDVGWIVWPKLGYDAIIEPDILTRMKADLDIRGIDYHAVQLRISDLWDSGHYDLWEKHGCGCIMEFDVSSVDSWSMQRIAEAIEHKEL